ncbi:MAG: hypothetical protein IJ480_03400 [Clostridia bacterium]|nr:hypothetical protein [Clostridia bacterium]
MYRRILLMLLPVLLLTACGAAEDTAAETDTETIHETTEEETMTPAETSWQLIPDPDWQSGFQLMSQKDHANGDYCYVKDTWKFTDNGFTPVWLLAQWDSGPCLADNRVESDPAEITDGQWRSVKYDADANSLTFHLDTSLYYGGRPAVQGDWWPHLLIEQTTFDYALTPASRQPYYHCDSEKMIVSFDIRLQEHTVTPIDGDWVQAAQFLMYFYVKGVDTSDFCWFGLQLFDNRWALNDHYIGYDGGKADASGAMIYSIGSRYIYENCETRLWKEGRPNVGGDWVHVEIDIAPYLEDMFRRGTEEGYFKAGSLSELIINGMNLGWETIGTFDHTMEIANVRLTSYRSDV